MGISPTALELPREWALLSTSLAYFLGRPLMASRAVSRNDDGRRLATETKHALKTTEFWMYLIVAIAILIAADNLGGGQGHDVFRADKAWLFVTVLTIGYMISRGLAKAGSREPYTEVQSTGDSSGIGDRVAKAVAVLKEGDVPTDHGEAAPTRGPGGTASSGPYTTR
jgi:hypothetical protein